MRQAKRAEDGKQRKLGVAGKKIGFSQTFKRSVVKDKQRRGRCQGVLGSGRGV